LELSPAAKAFLADIRDKENWLRSVKISRGSVARMNSLTLSILLGNTKLLLRNA
jgi:hypothetical protein